MKVSITGKQVDIGDALRLHTEQELTATVMKYFERPVAAQATFYRGTGQFHVDLHIHLFRRMVLQAQGAGDTAYAALAEALEHAATRLRRYKRRLKTHHEEQRVPDTLLAAQQYVLTPQTEDETTPEPAAQEQHLIIAEMTTETEIETLSVSEAAMRLDLGHLPAMLFRNPKHGGLNLVYQRRDGHIGWVDPQIPGESENPG